MADLIFHAEVVVLHIRLHVVLVENVNRRGGERGAGWDRTYGVCHRSAAGDVGMRGRKRRGYRGVKGQRLHVDSVIGIGRAVHDGWRRAVENAVAATDDELRIRKWLPGKAKARGEVVVIVG